MNLYPPKYSRLSKKHIQLFLYVLKLKVQGRFQPLLSSSAPRGLYNFKLESLTLWGKRPIEEDDQSPSTDYDVMR